ncbi:MAG: pantoate--beta-alanine ligase [Bdellovibrionales bacterium]
MKVLKTVSEARSFLGEDVGFVATMGALHEGHGSLIKRSKKENTQTCVSIFVNPTQFNNLKDLEQYPDRTEEDLLYCKNLGVDYVFMPEVSEIYGAGETISLMESTISKDFEGAHRPGHFNGVLQVVMRLLNIISPKRAYFGEKDYQQLKLIENMVAEYFMKVEVVGVPILREEHGLALSSRNYNLSKEGLLRAREIAKAFLETDSKESLLVKAPYIDLEYYGSDWGRTLIAHYIEGVRLIDNKPERGL